MIAGQIISFEKSALEKWCKGDPSGFIELSANDVTYFDPFMQKRLDGKDKLSELYESIRGKVTADSFDLENPCVQVFENTAVLTFNFVSSTNGEVSKWNCTEVYRYKHNKWEIIHTHWSFTQPELK